MAGAPVGNQNAARGKMWRAAIERALDKRSPSDRLAAIDALAEKLLAQCDEGEISALRELGDRLDGKPMQSVEASGPDGGQIPIGINVRFPGS